MKSITSEGQLKIQEIASKYRLSENAVLQMLHSVSLGGGSMAQFNIPELGGNGQWMKGGMTMVGDMFNFSLQGTVNNLCTELSQLINAQNIFEQPVKGSKGKDQNFGSWWPSEFGSPSSSGGQNNMRYAYFPSPIDRLAVDLGGNVTIYNSAGYNVSGVSQQQSGFGFTLQFSSQRGYVDVNKLPIVSSDTAQTTPATATVPPPTSEEEEEEEEEVTTVSVASSVAEEDIIKNIERLAGLLKKGILTEEEFLSKKKELLARL